MLAADYITQAKNADARVQAQRKYFSYAKQYIEEITGPS